MRFRDGETVWMASIYASEPSAIRCVIVHDNGREEISYQQNERRYQHDPGAVELFRSQSDALGEWHSERAVTARASAAAHADRLRDVDRVDSNRRRY